MCTEIDDKIAAFLNRPLEGDWPYLWLEATCVKVRATGRIVSVAVIVAVAVNSDGRGPSARGLDGVDGPRTASVCQVGQSSSNGGDHP